MTMKNTIVVAGATGNLGHRICTELIKAGTHVKAIVRDSSNPLKVDALKKIGVEIIEVTQFKEKELTPICQGASCVVSAVTGLYDVIVNAQLELLHAAIAAGVPRFIPSDFSSEFTNIPEGENRNFDLRKEFGHHLEKSSIKATTIFNGCFADILRYNTPLFNVKGQTVAYYDDKADWKIDFTTMDDTAAFTAKAALDATTPRYLRIASFRVSPNDLVALSEQYKDKKFKLVDMGSMEGFSAYNKIQRAQDSAGEDELYPKWQQAQYLYSMFLVHHEALDNDRYLNLMWSKVEDNI
ncbi:NmrA family NAD(P)-binding protein [Flavobacterium sp. Fl-77]|uniref:NmrA family NAD(P)-binding protein n=1 Tax=Flavobacterium flavipigmentatum TaxID=2893884 RepID=A0AAJ2SHV6_9FLAO|nr:MULTISPECIES: NmrA family NAD(P)-binding protein [unclassified Flavobacterium]MDX6182870.1 NmrA family NAD(P)-binding protein [Flavobacterium sp. Fl-33]MDX6186323.1 NmrA family NAD(P)-binding protein [Flavobacterium sp. Fl-77]UFH37888.1 NmrA family NAD(P)-binding protein [Flavobacterium sp. F-70]